MNGVPEAAEVTTSGGVPIEGVGAKGSIFTQEFTNNFAHEKCSRSVDNLEFF
jgi:hypothetical protein